MIRNQPAGDASAFEFVRYFRPTGSQTVLWAQDMERNMMIYLLRWGNNIYLPVFDGLKLGIGLYNGRDVHVAYPTYVEAANLWVGGPEEPEACTTKHMWELRPYERMVMDALMNPNAQKGRPLEILTAGEGYSIGEATFGTTEFRGQIRVYERLSLYGGQYQAQRKTNAGTGYGASRGGSRSAEGQLSSLGMKGLDLDAERGHAAIGAGDEERRSYVNTGVSYQRNTQPVVFLRTEFRSDLREMLARRWGSAWDWYWPFPTASLWWDEPWSWAAPSSPTAPYIPVKPRPHRGS